MLWAHCDEIVRAFRAVIIVTAIRVRQGGCKGLLPPIKVPGYNPLSPMKFLQVSCGARVMDLFKHLSDAAH
jgi:hypothetical protein